MQAERLLRSCALSVHSDGDIADKNKPRHEGARRGLNDLYDPGEFIQVPAQGGEAGDGLHRL